MSDTKPTDELRERIDDLERRLRLVVMIAVAACLIAMTARGARPSWREVHIP